MKNIILDYFKWMLIYYGIWCVWCFICCLLLPACTLHTFVFSLIIYAIFAPITFLFCVTVELIKFKRESRKEK